MRKGFFKEEKEQSIFKPLKNCIQAGSNSKENTVFSLYWIFGLILFAVCCPYSSQAQTGIDCYSCHGSATKDSHHATIQYQQGDCTYCHVGVNVTNDCTVCHTTVNSTQSSHHLSDAALQGNCAACHTGVSEYSNCKTCHGDDVRLPHHTIVETLGWACTNCHTQMQPVAGCTSCHGLSGQGNQHHASTWAVNGDCNYCHEMVWDVTINGYILEVRNCADCHLTSTGATLAERHHAQTTATTGQCTVCHVGADALLSSCAGCHTSSSQNHHALPQAVSGDCAHCHGGIALITTGCSSCHTGAIADQHHAGPLQSLGGDCRACHANISTPDQCANCHQSSPHHTTTWAANGDCTHCHARPAWAMDAPVQAACRQCHGATQHNKGGAVLDFGACFACHSPRPYHAKPNQAPEYNDPAPGKGSFNIFYNEFRRPEEYYEDTPMEEYGENVLKKDQGRQWRVPAIDFNWATIDHQGLSYEVPAFDSAPQPPPPTASTPTLSISSPKDGATVSGDVTIVITANDRDRISGVYTWTEGQQPVSMEGPDGSMSGTWSAAWDSTTVSDGLHMIYVEAKDNNNNLAQRYVSVNVVNGNPSGSNGSLTVCQGCHRSDHGPRVSCSDTRWTEHLTRNRVSQVTYDLAEMTYLGALCPRGGTPTTGVDLGTVCVSCHSNRSSQIRCFDRDWREHIEHDYIDRTTAQAAERFYLGYVCDWNDDDHYHSAAVGDPAPAVCISCHEDRTALVDCENVKWRKHLSDNLVTVDVYDAAEVAYADRHCGGGFTYSSVIESGVIVPANDAGLTAAGADLASVGDLTKCLGCHDDNSAKLNCRSKSWLRHLRKNYVGKSTFRAAEITYTGAECGEAPPVLPVKDRSRKIK